MSVCSVPCGSFFDQIFVSPLLPIEMRMFILCHCILEVCNFFYYIGTNKYFLESHMRVGL